jgi:GDPmannose 4,6-dehydratase
VEMVARHLGMEVHWRGEGVDEKGYETSTGRCIVAVDPRYFRPTEVDTLLGDPTKAQQKLGWRPRISFEALIEEMVREDLKLAERDHLVTNAGFQVYIYHE